MSSLKLDVLRGSRLSFSQIFGDLKILGRNSPLQEAQALTGKVADEIVVMFLLSSLTNVHGS